MKNQSSGSGISVEIRIMVNDSEELHTMTLSPGQKFSIGRLSDSDIVISHPAVSRKQMDLSVTGSRTRRSCLCIRPVPGATNPVIHRGKALEKACTGRSFDLSVGPVNIRIKQRRSSSAAKWPALGGIVLIVPVVVLLSHSLGKHEGKAHGAVTDGGTKAVECACTGTATCRRRASRSLELAQSAFVRGRMDAAALVRSRKLAAGAACFASRAGDRQIIQAAEELRGKIRKTINIEKKKAAVSLDYFMEQKNTAAALKAALRLEKLLGPDESSRKRKIELVRARLEKAQGGI